MGFFIYIDNKQGYDVLKQILEVSDKRCQIKLKETIGVKNEIVLNNIWSDEMQHTIQEGIGQLVNLNKCLRKFFLKRFQTIY